MKKIHITAAGELKLGEHFGFHLLLIPLIFSACQSGYFRLFALSWLSALLHETAHIFTGIKLGVSFSGISLLPFGICARLRQPVIKSPLNEILIALAGPFCNLFLSGIFGLLSPFLSMETTNYGISANLAMFCLNLLPCLPLDGGRILRALLTLGSDALTAWRISLQISRILSVCLLVISVLLLLSVKFQFSLLLIGVFLLGNLCTEQRGLSRQALREILYHKEKLELSQFNRTATLTADYRLPARKLLRQLSYHCYYIIQVVDENQRIIKTLTEGQILHSLLNQGIRLTLGEIT